MKFWTLAEIQPRAECGAAVELTDLCGSPYTIHHPSDPPCRQLRSQFVSKLMLKSGWRNLQKAPDAADRFSQPKRSANISMSTNGRWRASGRPWVHLIAGPPRTGQSMGQFLGRQARAARSQTIGEMNIVWSPEAIEDLASLRAYIAEDNPAAARRTVRHIMSIEQFIPNKSTDRPRRTGAGHAQTLSFPCRPSSPIGFSERQSRSCAFITGRDVGLTVFDLAGSLGRRKPGTLVELGLRIMG